MKQGIKDLRDWIDDTVSHMVNHPRDVKVNVVDKGVQDGRDAFMFLVQLNESDRGLVIGARGSTIRALRLLVAKQAFQLRSIAFLELAEETREAG